MTPTATSPKPLRALLSAWLTAGTLDITAAGIQYYIRTGKGPGGVLRFVASGLLGRKAFAGGNTAAAWGLLFHYCNALLFTLFFFWLFPRLKIMGKNLWVTGLCYGVFTWCVMNLLVVPASRAPHIPFVPGKAAVAMMILMVCIGLPIALIIGRYYQTKSRAAR